jgi:hypothetical protein
MAAQLKVFRDESQFTRFLYQLPQIYEALRGHALRVGRAAVSLRFDLVKREFAGRQVRYVETRLRSERDALEQLTQLTREYGSHLVGIVCVGRRYPGQVLFGLLSVSSERDCDRLWALWHAYLDENLEKVNVYSA